VGLISRVVSALLSLLALPLAAATAVSAAELPPASSRAELECRCGPLNCQPIRGRATE